MCGPDATWWPYKVFTESRDRSAATPARLTELLGVKLQLQQKSTTNYFYISVDLNVGCVTYD